MARVVVLLIIFLLLVGALAVLRGSLGRVEIRGTLTRADLREITRLHGSQSQSVWSPAAPKWIPATVRDFVSGTLNPIETIAAPGNGKVIIAYRGFRQYYYDEKGKHRWGVASYTLVKGTNGWQTMVSFP
jgi:hypothetical protein